MAFLMMVWTAPLLLMAFWMVFCVLWMVFWIVSVLLMVFLMVSVVGLWISRLFVICRMHDSSETREHS